jgi:hypothetical protein
MVELDDTFKLNCLNSIVWQVFDDSDEFYLILCCFFQQCNISRVYYYFCVYYYFVRGGGVAICLDRLFEFILLPS